MAKGYYGYANNYEAQRARHQEMGSKAKSAYNNSRPKYDSGLEDAKREYARVSAIGIRKAEESEKSSRECELNSKKYYQAEQKSIDDDIITLKLKDSQGIMQIEADNFIGIIMPIRI